MATPDEIRLTLPVTPPDDYLPAPGLPSTTYERWAHAFQRYIFELEMDYRRSMGADFYPLSNMEKNVMFFQSLGKEGKWRFSSLPKGGEFDRDHNEFAEDARNIFTLKSLPTEEASTGVLQPASRGETEPSAVHEVRQIPPSSKPMPTAERDRGGRTPTDTQCHEKTEVVHITQISLGTSQSNDKTADAESRQATSDTTEELGLGEDETKLTTPAMTSDMEPEVGEDKANLTMTADSGSIMTILTPHGMPAEQTRPLPASVQDKELKKMEEEELGFISSLPNMTEMIQKLHQTQDDTLTATKMTTLHTPGVDNSRRDMDSEWTCKKKDAEEDKRAFHDLRRSQTVDESMLMIDAGFINQTTSLRHKDNNYKGHPWIAQAKQLYRGFKKKQEMDTRNSGPCRSSTKDKPESSDTMIK